MNEEKARELLERAAELLQDYHMEIHGSMSSNCYLSKEIEEFLKKLS